MNVKNASLNANGTCEEGWKRCLDLCVDYSDVYDCPITDITVIDKGTIKRH